MIYFQIALGLLIIIYSILNYFFHSKSSFFIAKRIIAYLSESERIKYQKAHAIPTALLGIIIVILGVFFIDNDVFSIIYLGSYIAWVVCSMIINKIHLGYFSVWSIPKKIF